MSFLDSVKNIAGDVGDTIKKGAKTTSDNAKKLAEKSRLKRDISNCEGEINKIYAEIGKKYFAEIRNNPSDEYIGFVESILKNEKQIEDSKKQLSELEDKCPCPNCGVLLFKEQKFCDKCGAKVSLEAEVKEEVQTETVSEPVEAANDEAAPVKTATDEAAPVETVIVEEDIKIGE